MRALNEILEAAGENHQAAAQMMREEIGVPLPIEPIIVLEAKVNAIGDSLAHFLQWLIERLSAEHNIELVADGEPIVDAVRFWLDFYMMTQVYEIQRAMKTKKIEVAR